MHAHQRKVFGELRPKETDAFGTPAHPHRRLCVSKPRQAIPIGRSYEDGHAKGQRDCDIVPAY
jgi:hypothetical protein